MDTHDAPMPEPLPADVQQRIRRYRPRAISPDDWDRCRATVTELVAAAPPADATDARNLLSSSVTFLAFAAPRAGCWDLRKLLDGNWLSRFVDDWRAHGGSDNTLRNHLGDLHRLQRTAAGGDGSRRIRRLDRKPKKTSRPYGQVERTALTAGLGLAPPRVAETVRLVMTLADRGIVVPEAYEHGLTKSAWERARRWVKDHRLPQLDHRALRRMWALQVVLSAHPAEALHLLSRDELDGLIAHLTRGDPSVVQEQLRSF